MATTGKMKSVVVDDDEAPEEEVCRFSLPFSAADHPPSFSLLENEICAVTSNLTLISIAPTIAEVSLVVQPVFTIQS